MACIPLTQTTLACSSPIDSPRPLQY
jgi:hypothetical protein